MQIERASRDRFGRHPQGFVFFGVGNARRHPRILPNLQGARPIANELLLKLDLHVSPRTIRKYLPKSFAPAATLAAISVR
jgi:hypothetical protein